MATVVLPVLRSPMISSRWPRPIGVIASIALMPVCSGSCTGLRPMMPGAWISMRRNCTPTSSPLPSIGSPSALTTRPSTPSPTGTDRMRPVALTVWPSSMPVDVAEHDGADRVLVEVQGETDRAVLELEQLVDGAVGQAVTRAMPSPTSATRPTVRASSDGSKPSRFFLSADAMSAAERVSSAMVVILLQPALQLVDAGADGAVDDGVADGGDDAAEHGGVDDDLEVDVLAGGVRRGPPSAGRAGRR